MSTAGLVVVAAGRGSRAGGGVPKQYRPLGGRPLLAHTLDAFLAHAGIGAIVTTIHPDDRALYDAAIAACAARDRLAAPVAGGETRQLSVLAGLEALAAAGPVDLVLVHDAARPMVSSGLIDRALAAGAAHGAATPGVAVTDTIKVVDGRGMVATTPDRASLRAVQTPQAFRFGPLLEAHRRARAAGLTHFTDDGALAEWAGLPVAIFEGDRRNVKITTESDLAEAERALRPPAAALVTRVGAGYDVHAFAPGDHVWIGGVRIAHECGVDAHSDGDVVLHALTDALLGALADGDIGVHFPPSDPAWRGASSDRFLAYAAEKVRARGGVIDHLDATLVCEAPRVGPHREAIRARIAEIAGLPAAVGSPGTELEFAL